MLTIGAGHGMLTSVLGCSTRRTKNSLSLNQRLRGGPQSFKLVLHQEMSAMESARMHALTELDRLGLETTRLMASFVEQVTPHTGVLSVLYFPC
jgi:hypothetical protein